MISSSILIFFTLPFQHVSPKNLTRKKYIVLYRQYQNLYFIMTAYFINLLLHREMMGIYIMFFYDRNIVQSSNKFHTGTLIYML